MTRIATPDNENYLLTIAHNGTAFHMEALVSKYRRAKSLQDLQEANEQHKQRELRVYYEPNGAVVIKVRLAAEQGAIVRKAIDAAMEQLDAEDAKARDTVDDDVTAETPEKESFEKRRADALVAISESWLANGPTSSSLGERFQVMLHVSAETLNDQGGEVSHLDDGHRVSAETSRRLSCDGSMSEVSRDKQGNLLNIGRKSRIIPAAMRRALRTRDPGCRFPGCTHLHYIDGHHIEHWSKGGETRLDNLIQLCRKHHRLVHEGGFACAKNTEGQVEFRDQAGVLIARTGRIRPLPPDLDITERLQHRFEELHISAATAACHWDDRIDWDLAVGALYHPPCVPRVN
jgi:hypothetical protein